MLKIPSGRKVGEGTLVQYVGFLLGAHYSNVGKGELVNCKNKGKDANDIHIELVKTPGEEDECNGVTAEMSPHFRPASWGELAGMTIKRPVRVTGPLFFDGSHAPCHDNVRPKPNRNLSLGDSSGVQIRRVQAHDARRVQGGRGCLDAEEVEAGWP